MALLAKSLLHHFLSLESWQFWLPWETCLLWQNQTVSATYLTALLEKASGPGGRFAYNDKVL